MYKYGNIGLLVYVIYVYKVIIYKLLKLNFFLGILNLFGYVYILWK